ncbi:hypothetical protein BWQ96_02887 [Gracilariopsis chorda]|uniref:Uncharacterized protein n=1 Tax=Gracilariopsis chorda TaxID=448386 RepID=A0A2V3IYQ7_9FLOR|nr:hypothetical protein BWQ96_02887 [Gracilariopsis chorda]|eukprot:PXF47274.1 hypothetical protein BWQ96_02887 [Gracilariopsis chorda]
METDFKPFADKLPVWFAYLYVHRPQLLVPCFQIISIPRKYLFQGTGYTESSNAGYRAYVLSMKIRFSDIRKQMREMTRKRAADRREAQIRSVTPHISNFRSIRNDMLPFPPDILDALKSEHTSDSLTKFMKISIDPSRNYADRRAYVTSLEENHWPELHLQDGESVSDIACFGLTCILQFV